ncbi:MAG: hypothetical protein AB1744_07635 [Candidatus Zixiibacteriota bacterium]
MSHHETLRSLEQVLESFLERAVAAKAPRLDILDGINRIDDVARGSNGHSDLADRVGEWLAEYSGWLSDDNRLRPGDVRRLSEILAEIGDRLDNSSDNSPAAAKIRSELKRWTEGTDGVGRQLVLKRGPETAPPPRSRTVMTFDRLLERLLNRYRSLAGSRQHLLSVLEESLKTARVDHDRDALLLSGFIIYYLKLNSFKIEPYVQRLKQIEAIVREEQGHA